MSRFECSEESKTIVSDPLRLAFLWDGDRWGHSIALSGVEIAVSQESVPDRDDPLAILSPTFQQCHTQEVPEAKQALLVGLWGANHCSGVFQLEENLAGVTTVKVDVAVRSRSKLNGFAATYRIRLTSQELVSADVERIVWKISGLCEGELVLEPGEGSTVVLAEAGRMETAVQVVQPVDPSLSTQRMTYTWHWRPLT